MGFRGTRVYCAPGGGGVPHPGGEPPRLRRKPSQFERSLGVIFLSRSKECRVGKSSCFVFSLFQFMILFVGRV